MTAAVRMRSWGASPLALRFAPRRHIIATAPAVKLVMIGTVDNFGDKDDATYQSEKNGQ